MGLNAIRYDVYQSFQPDGGVSCHGLSSAFLKSSLALCYHSFGQEQLFGLSRDKGWAKGSPRRLSVKQVKKLIFLIGFLTLMT
jgi:hypothetical protein